MNLSSLGITLQDQRTGPTEDNFPVGFNQQTSKYWPIAVGLVNNNDPKKAWKLTIEKFLDLCTRNNEFPFHHEQSRNDQILLELIKARRTVVKFIDTHKIMSEMPVLSASRIVTLTPTGFCLKVDAQARRKNDDPTFLTAMGLRRATSLSNVSWTRDLAANTQFFVYNDGARMSQRWHYGYTIEVPIFPHIPGNPLPSTKELEEFILHSMYMPILRAYRPINGHFRLV